MKLFFCLALLCCTTAVLSQVTISGVITGDQNKPLGDAAILLKRASDSVVMKTSITDIQGIFRFDKIASGKYFIVVTAVNYRYFATAVLNCSEQAALVDAGIIHLTSSAGNLQAVTVTSARPFIERKIDRLVVNVASSPLHAGQSAFDVLERSPGITIDESDNISINGKQGAVVYIEGKQSYLSGKDLAAYLKGVPASQVDQIEIMTQPSARYDAAGNAGVINLKWKKNTTDGFGGSISTTAIFSRNFKTRDAIVFTWKQGKMNVSLNYSYASIVNDISTTNTRSYRKDESTAFHRYLAQDASTRVKQFPHVFRVNMDYALTKNTSIGMAAYGSYSGLSQLATGIIRISDSLHRLLQYTSYSTLSKNSFSNPGFNMGIQQKMRGGRLLTADLDYVKYHSPVSQLSMNELYDKDGRLTDMPSLRNTAPLDVNIYSFKADYSQPLTPGSKLEAGVKSGYIQTDDDILYSYFKMSSGQWLADTGRTNHFVYHENINAAYLNYSTELGKKWSLQGGLRVEQTVSQGNEHVKGSSFSRNYWQLFPTVFIGYSASADNKFSLSFGRRITRPNYQLLNPFESIIDQYNIRDGNPGLRPMLTYNTELSYNFKNQLNITVMYVRTDGIVNAIFHNVKRGADYITYQTPYNLSRRRNIGGSIDYHKNFGKWLKTGASITLLHGKIHEAFENFPTDAQVVICFVNLSAQVVLNHGWTFDAAGVYRSKRLEGYPVFADPSHSVSVGISKKIRQKTTLTVNCNDVFQTFHSGFSAATGTYNLQAKNYPESRNVGITLNYRFGKNGQQNKKTNNVLDEQSRL